MKFNKKIHMKPEAVAELATKSNSQKLVLVHISSYFLENINDFKNETEVGFKNEVIIAKDFMELEIK